MPSFEGYNSSDNQFQSYTNTYTTFSGADITASFGGTAIGNLMGITWSVTREKAPIYTMGSPNPRSFSRGKRGLAGSLIFMVFDRPSLYQMLLKNKDDPSLRYYTRAQNAHPGWADSKNGAGISPAFPSANDSDAQSEFDRGALNIQDHLPYYSDQIPPFDVTITFANEYGQAAVRTIYGIELLNEGSGASMDDIVIEETMTYVARDVGPMIALNARDNLSPTLDADIITP